ncbi:MAG TPA: NUDIX hydrolase [Acidobacteriaceae bacterium]|nr:NUDIX hydrolase [Acidobacteriaceae bacterium]
MRSGQKTPLKLEETARRGKTKSKTQKHPISEKKLAPGKKTAPAIPSRAAKSPSAHSSVHGKKGGKVALISSKLVYQGPLFDVYTDYVREPEGETARRDVIRHSGSVVILAVDDTRNPADPLIVVERQYRHAAGQYMWEIPAGRKEPEEAVLPGAKRELLEETGYIAKRWSKIARFYVSPGFLGEWMQVYLAEGLSCGESAPDEDEYIHHQQIPLSQALEWIDSGKIIDAKSIIAILMYVRRHAAGTI